MYTGLIAKRYATALADFAAGNGEEQQVRDEVERLVVFYRNDRRMRDTLFSPVLSTATKKAFLWWALGEAVSRTLNGFLSLVFRHRREKHLSFMLYSHQTLYKEKHKVLDATLTTAAPVEHTTVERIAGIVRESAPGYEVCLHRKTDPALIGGFVFRMDDLFVDASLSRQLGSLHRQFGNTQNRIV